VIVDSGVGQLQSRKIADPVSPLVRISRSGIHLPTVCSLAGEGGFINRAWIELTPRATLRPAAGRLDQLPRPDRPVVGADVEVNPPCWRRAGPWRQ